MTLVLLYHKKTELQFTKTTSWKHERIWKLASRRHFTRFHYKTWIFHIAVSASTNYVSSPRAPITSKSFNGGLRVSGHLTEPMRQ